MEKTIQVASNAVSVGLACARRAWVSLIILLVAAGIIGTGVYLRFQPDWTLRDDIRQYNRAVATYQELLWAPLVASEQSLLTVYPHVVENAGGRFERAGSASTDSKLKSLATYNLGTMIGRAAFFSQPLPGVEVPEALTKLSEAIRYDPDNEDAKFNLELMERMMERKEEEAAGPGEGYSPGSVYKGF